MPRGRVRLTRLILLTVTMAGPSCGAPTAATTPPVSCASTIIIGLFPNGAPPSPGQGMEWMSYFAATLLPAQSSVYIVDVNSMPAGCFGGAWTAVSANTAAVQLSPASGNGRSQVELFIPASTAAQRSTLVTIAGQTATISQAGR